MMHHSRVGPAGLEQPFAPCAVEHRGGDARLIRSPVLHAQWGVAPWLLAAPSASRGNGEATRRLGATTSGRWLWTLNRSFSSASTGRSCRGFDGAAVGKATEGSTEHQVCLTGTGEPIQRAFAHDANGIGAMVD